MKQVGVYFILNDMHSENGIITDANNVISAGIKIIHYSEKRLRKREVLENAYILSALCKKNNVLFIVEDYPDIAALVSADGVHLTQPDFSVEHVRKIIGHERLIGINFTSLRDAVYAEEHGADYIGVDTRAAQISVKSALSSMKKMRDLLTVPIVALGTFTLEQTQGLLVAGIDGVGMMPLVANEGIEHYVKQMLAIQVRKNF